MKYLMILLLLAGCSDKKMCDKIRNEVRYMDKVIITSGLYRDFTGVIAGYGAFGCDCFNIKLDETKDELRVCLKDFKVVK